MRLVMLKNAAEFRRVRGGARFSCDTFAIEAKERSGVDDEVDSTPRFGLIVTKKLGGAVTRNRIRRRIKEALRGTAGGLTRPRTDYVILARKAVHDIAFADLMQAFEKAFAYLGRKTARGGSEKRKGKPPDVAPPADNQSKRRQSSD